MRGGRSVIRRRLGVSLIAGGLVVSAIAALSSLRSPATVCRAHEGLPDPVCTPGAVNADVRQENIGSTICVPGWTAMVRPPAAYTNALKRQQMAEYGLTSNPADYEEDHLISLELGGHPSDPHNLWPERWTGTDGAHAKDRVENALHRRVCAGEITLARAQRIIASDWRQIPP